MIQAGLIGSCVRMHLYLSAKSFPGFGKVVKHVIVIDDDKAVGGAIKLWLEIEGAAVTFVDDGTAGIEAIKSGDFDLVLIDLFMPGINGIEAIKTVHEIKPTLPIIAMSGLICDQAAAAPSDIVEQATRSGAAKAIHKPFRPRDLMQAIEGCLGGSLGATKGSTAGTNSEVTRTVARAPVHPQHREQHEQDDEQRAVSSRKDQPQQESGDQHGGRDQP